IHPRSGFFQDGISTNHFGGHKIFADAEVCQGPLGLCPPEFIGRNLDLPEAIAFYPVSIDHDGRLGE
ncbi:MAG: hypothetical protein ACKODT_01920, partial [Fluviibacter sp.]